MVFQILAKVEMMQTKNWLFSRHFETVQHFHIFPGIMVFHTYMVQISLQNSGGKVVFLGGSMEPPLGTNGSKSTMVT